MSSNKSQANSNGTEIRVTISDAIEEVRRIFKALNNKLLLLENPIDTDKLLKAEQALNEQSISGEAYITFFSVLAQAEREASVLAETNSYFEPGNPVSTDHVE